MILDNCDKSMKIMAGPGTGKTMTILLILQNLFQIKKIKPESVILTTFNVEAWKNLKRLLALYEGELGLI